jgi:hypothetical protein
MDELQAVSSVKLGPVNPSEKEMRLASIALADLRK